MMLWVPKLRWTIFLVSHCSEKAMKMRHDKNIKNIYLLVTIIVNAYMAKPIEYVLAFSACSFTKTTSRQSDTCQFKCGQANHGHQSDQTSPATANSIPRHVCGLIDDPRQEVVQLSSSGRFKSEPDPADSRGHDVEISAPVDQHSGHSDREGAEGKNTKRRSFSRRMWKRTKLDKVCYKIQVYEIS